MEQGPKSKLSTIIGNRTVVNVLITLTLCSNIGIMLANHYF